MGEKINYKTSEQNEVRNFIIVVLAVVACVGVFYFITRAFVSKDLFESDDKKEETKETVEINYDVAIFGNMLTKADKEYYVLIYDQSDKGEYVSDMIMLLSKYDKKREEAKKDKKKVALPVYTVDLSNKLNDGYYDPKKVNVKATGLEDLKVGDITLLKVKNGKISKYIVDYAKMEKELGLESK